jgi:asparagine synthase (glutamine-hydrolysing)
MTLIGADVRRNLVERFFNKIKHCRRVATRYDKLERRKGYFPVPGLRYLRGPFLAFVRDMLNDPRPAGKMSSTGRMSTAPGRPGRQTDPEGTFQALASRCAGSLVQTHGIN